MRTSKLKGQNLVQYAKSLVGRDLKQVVQVAPFVVKDLVCEESYAAWVALAALCPVAWAPEVGNVEEYCVSRNPMASP